VEPLTWPAAQVAVVARRAGQRGTAEPAEDHRRQGDRDHRAQRPEPVDEALPRWGCSCSLLLQGRVRRQHAVLARGLRLGLERLSGRIAVTGLAGLVGLAGLAGAVGLGGMSGQVGHGSMVRVQPVAVL
jgi:hypothetical protein